MWTLGSASGPDFNLVHESIQYMSEKRFHEYIPTAGPFPSFEVRLVTWLDNTASEDDQKTLFQMVPQLFFVGRDEFTALHRSALRLCIVPWLIDELGIDVCAPNIDQVLEAAVSSTWFCPITDSMGIAAFYHVNHLEGADLRPDWRSLASLGDPPKIKQHMDDNQFRRIVLLEDFVGSGSQMENAVRFAATMPGQPSLLVVPLMVCPTGSRLGEQLEQQHGHVAFRPVMKLPMDGFIYPTPIAGESEMFVRFRDLANRTYSQVAGSGSSSGSKPYGPFGFEDTGALVVMYANCPDNTLPMIHNASVTVNSRPMGATHVRLKGGQFAGFGAAMLIA